MSVPLNDRVVIAQISRGDFQRIEIAVQSYRGKYGLDFRKWFFRQGVWYPSEEGVRLYADELGVLGEALAFYSRLAAKNPKTCFRLSQAPRAQENNPRKNRTNPRATNTNPRAVKMSPCGAAAAGLYSEEG